MCTARRLAQLPPYLFVEIDKAKRKAIEDGRAIIDFGVGDPDGPTPGFIVESLVEAVSRPENRGYPPSQGTVGFREVCAQYMKRRFGVSVDPACEILALIGSKEGIGHLPLAVVNPQDVVLTPDPGYPVYQSGTIFAGGQCYSMPLREENNWFPDLAQIPPKVTQHARLMFLNYPNNPTGGVAARSQLEQAVEFAGANNLLIAHDAAYSEIYFDSKPPSILEIPGAKEVCVEFHSLSKTFNMTGWRIGFVVGNAATVAALAKVKNNYDSGVFRVIQHAAGEALNRFDGPEIEAVRQLYAHRRKDLINGLSGAGWKASPCKATFYVWAKCPAGYDSMTTAARLLQEADVVAVPGIGFGSQGEGFLRFALTVEQDRIREAVERIQKVEW